MKLGYNYSQYSCIDSTPLHAVDGQLAMAFQKVLMISRISLMLRHNYKPTSNKKFFYPKS
jgi:hypothetical protein